MTICHSNAPETEAQTFRETQEAEGTEQQKTTRISMAEGYGCTTKKWRPRKTYITEANG